ncbi:MAG: alpha/beta hydrolase, partial [Saprospiraceae bacterium]|nr:alpha/beta hydrolase [Saprospiraceae bacterium]
MSHIYFIPGLGFDSRLFSKLDLKGDQLHNIDWIEPESDEPIGEYAKRISRNIIHEDATLIGHSFGGIISLEIANHIPVKNIFLISSISSPSEIPFSFKLISKLRL